MDFQTLREKHPCFIYDSFSIEQKEEILLVRFTFILEPDIVFNPEITLPITAPISIQVLEPLVFHLGLVEMISYWKAACSPKIQIRAGRLEKKQISWWHDLFIHGLGEFYYKNKIDFTTESFLSLEIAEDAPSLQPREEIAVEAGDLILVAGGKDSAVSLELLRDVHKKKAAFSLNPTRATKDSVKVADYNVFLSAVRRIDPKLIELNGQGYLNGHTPFSAYLAFLAVLTAAANGFDRIIVSNEWSANEPNTHCFSMPINHQYSKSLRFENLFRSYSSSWLIPQIEYFSFLRPLLDLQIAYLLSKYPKHLPLFRSCNVGQKQDIWCGGCPKCAFVYLSLYPFLEEDQILSVFGGNLFLKPTIQQHVRALVGLSELKPFECVGTEAESQAAVLLGLRERPQLFLESLKRELEENGLLRTNLDLTLSHWASENNLSPEDQSLLQGALSKSTDTSNG